MTEKHLFKPDIEEIDDTVQQPQFVSELLGMIKTVDTAPSATTDKPVRLIDQIKFYSSGATYRLYIYDTTNNVWRYASLT